MDGFALFVNIFFVLFFGLGIFVLLLFGIVLGLFAIRKGVAWSIRVPWTIDKPLGMLDASEWAGPRQFSVCAYSEGLEQWFGGDYPANHD